MHFDGLNRVVGAGSCLRALSEAFLPRVLEEGSGYSGRRATGKSHEILARVELVFQHYQTSVDPVKGAALYTQSTSALHDRVIAYIRSHQLSG